ncbi:MAG: hypothetical protein QJR07_06975 [Acetobacteraceae bacterium]|nr:hypothetical protein [Acetobacteraceae bacterium]
MLRERRLPPADIFPAEPWALEAVRYDAKLAHAYAGQAETMFALANGYLGFRGTPGEARPVQDPGVLLNGFYEFRPITYGEHAYGFPRLGQSILNCPGGTIIKLFVDGERFLPAEAEVLSFHQVLDLRAGTLSREIAWATPAGGRMRLRSLRLTLLGHFLR